MNQQSEDIKLGTTSEQYSNHPLMRRIFQIQKLGAMPQIVWRLVGALRNEGTTPTQLEELIEADPALTSKVLSLANSAYYGSSQQVTTVRRAIVIMGFEELQILAVGAGLAQIFDLSRLPIGLDIEALWVHCVAVGWTARELAEAAGYPVPSEIMVAGLLHDLGKLILAMHLSDEYQKVLDVERAGLPYYEAEERCDLMHTTIGYWLARRWGLPELLESAIRDHHHWDRDMKFFVPTGFVSLANNLVKRLEFGLIHESRPVDIPGLVRALELTPDQVKDVATAARRQLPKSIEAWGQMIH